MRRILTIVLGLVVLAAVVFGVYSWRSSQPSKPQYTVELDNAFGLVGGADLKVAGVRAGKIKKLRVDQKTHRALVDFEINKPGFGSLRKDVFCVTRPQSLIGEYYIDCTPGKSPQALKSGSTIPVSHTASTIPFDLVANVLRRPYRERLSIILSELGVGVAGRASEIQDVVHRASPALRETDAVLEKLARQNKTLKQLVTDADQVIGDLAGNEKDVGRFVVEAKNTAQASAERRADIAAGLHRLPTFLRELKPTMADLGAAADASTPYLRDLNASAGQLQRFLENLGPFAEASRVNIRSLAKTSDVGRPAVRSARPTVAELTRTTAKAPELANNLRIVLKDLDDRSRAVEKDPRSPRGLGYTGFEAFLSYVFDQMMAINIFDENGHILKVNLSATECSDFQNADSLRRKEKESPGFIKRCGSYLGPNQPGVTTPDPSDTGVDDPGPAGLGIAASRNAKDKRVSSRKANGGARAAKSTNSRAQPDLKQALQRLLGGGARKAPAPNVTTPSVPSARSAPNVNAGSSDPQALLDYLLSP